MFFQEYRATGSRFDETKCRSFFLEIYFSLNTCNLFPKIYYLTQWSMCINLLRILLNRSVLLLLLLLLLPLFALFITFHSSICRQNSIFKYKLVELYCHTVLVYKNCYRLFKLIKKRPILWNDCIARLKRRMHRIEC